MVGAATHPDIPPHGSTFGRFIVGETIGNGEMGVVVSARDPVLERDVALKLVRGGQSDDLGNEGRARLVREARSMAKLAHPNVLTILEAGIEQERVYLAMERVNGGTLRELVARGTLSSRDIVRMYAAAGRGLAAAHQAGLIHRDFKSDNVLVDGERVLVADFGLVGVARQVASERDDIDPHAETGRLIRGANERIEDRVTLAGMVVGTPAYMAPEQSRGGSIDARCDQFSFCVALYESLYGHLPFHGATLTAYLESMQTEGVRRPESTSAPGWVHAALLRGLSLDPERRFASMGELLDQLTAHPDESLFGSRARIVAMCIIISAVILWALVSAIIDYTLTYLAMAVVDVACLALALVVIAAIGKEMRTIPLNRKVLFLGLGTIVSSITLVAGGYLAGVSATAMATLHLLVTFTFALGGTILLDRRLVIPAVAYFAAFFIAAINHDLFFAVTAVAHSITGATLIRVLGPAAPPAG